MAIGDKIDWRAGTIDPTTLQLIASAGAAQGAMYQNLGESVSKAFEKDSEDYIVDAGKAFDKADKLLEREDDEDFNKEKYEKLIKKGVNLFRKAGEKYNIISGGFYGDSTLRTEEDIYKFYGFDPSKSPRPYPIDHGSGYQGPMGEKQAREEQGSSATDGITGSTDPYSEGYFSTSDEGGVPPLSKTPLGTGSTDPLSGMNTGEDWINPYSPSRATGPSRAAIGGEIKAAYPDAFRMLPDPQSAIDSVGRALDYNYPIPTNTGVESGRELPSIKQIANLSADAVIERAVPNLEAMWDITKRGGEALVSGGTKVWDYISGGTSDIINSILNRETPESELSDETLSQMNQPSFPGQRPNLQLRSFVDPTEDFNQNPFNPTLNSLGLDEQIDPFSGDYYTEEDKETIKGYHQSNFR
jgi:hypothetical protein